MNFCAVVSGRRADTFNIFCRTFSAFCKLVKKSSHFLGQMWLASWTLGPNYPIIGEQAPKLLTDKPCYFMYTDYLLFQCPHCTVRYLVNERRRNRELQLKYEVRKLELRSLRAAWWLVKRKEFFPSMRATQTGFRYNTAKKIMPTTLEPYFPTASPSH